MSPLGICEKMKALSFKMKGAGPLIRPSEIGDGRSKIYKFVQDGALIFKFICYLCKKVSPIEQLNVERAVALHSIDASEDSIVHAADSFIELLGFRVVHHHTVTPLLFEHTYSRRDTCAFSIIIHFDFDRGFLDSRCSLSAVENHSYCWYTCHI